MVKLTQEAKEFMREMESGGIASFAPERMIRIVDQSPRDDDLDVDSPSDSTDE